MVHAVARDLAKQFVRLGLKLLKRVLLQGNPRERFLHFYQFAETSRILYDCADGVRVAIGDGFQRGVGVRSLVKSQNFRYQPQFPQMQRREFVREFLQPCGDVLGFAG